MINTNFGLTITSGVYYLEIKVEDTYLGTLCGLCGSYTNDPTEDFTKPDFSLALDPTEFGDSWKVQDSDLK